MTEFRNDATAICVLGMHRSGTSAITGVLHALGAFLGPAAHLMKPREDNPAGFFEHQLLTDLNDELLHALGGSWLEPPPLDEGWERAPHLEDIRGRAQQRLREDFGDTPLWVWKDPRTCLTLPFWRPLLPRTTYVVCVRNPIDVARSLETRDGLAQANGADLWMRYTAAALMHCPETPLLIAYDDVVSSPTDAVARLAGILERDVPHDAVARARAFLVDNRGLRHHRTSLSALCATPAASSAAVTFYAVLQGWVELQRVGALPTADMNAMVRPLVRRAMGAHAAERDAEGPSRRLTDVEAALGAREAELAHARADVVKLDGWLREAFAVRARLDAALVVRESEAVALHAHIAGDAASLAELHARVAADNTRLDTLHAQIAGDAVSLAALHTHLAADAVGRTELEAQVQRMQGELQTHLRRTEAEASAAAVEVGRLNTLLLHLQTPSGVAKLAARALLPPAVHRTLRAWGMRVFRGSSSR